MNRPSLIICWLLLTCRVFPGELTLAPAESEPQWVIQDAKIARSALGDRFIRMENSAGKMAFLNSPMVATGGLARLELEFTYRTAVAGSRAHFGAWVLISISDREGKSVATLDVVCPPSPSWNTLHKEFTLPQGAATAAAQFRLQNAPGRFDLKRIKLLTGKGATGERESVIPLSVVERLDLRGSPSTLKSAQRTLLPLSSSTGALAFPWPGSREAKPQAVYEIETSFSVGPGLATGKSEALFTFGRNMNGSQPNSVTLMVWEGKSLFSRLTSANMGLTAQVIKNVPSWRQGQKHTVRVRFSAKEITLWLDGNHEGTSHLAVPFSPETDRPVYIGGESASESLWSGSIESFAFTILQPRIQAVFPGGCEAGCFRGPGPHEWTLEFGDRAGKNVVSKFHVENNEGQRVGKSFGPIERTARAHRVKLPELPFGRYRLIAELQFDGGEASVGRSFAIVNPWNKLLPAERSSFGIQHETRLAPDKFDATVMRDNFVIARASGARWWRLWLRWDDIELKPGVYSWNALDLNVATAQELGLSLLPNITGGALPFQTTQPLKKETWGMMSTACYAPVDMQRWSAFLTAMAQRYRGKIGYYQIWNEPDARNGLYPFSPKTYAEILKASASAIRAADPNIKVVLGGFAAALMGDCLTKTSHTNADSCWGAPEFYALKPEADYDIADAHFYSANEPGQSWDRVKSLAEGARNYLRAKGEGNKPFWNSETSMYTGKPGENGGWANVPCLSETAQAEELVKLHVQSLAAGITRTFWYGLKGDIGIFNDDASPKDAFVAHVNLVRIMQGARFVQEHQVAPNLRAYEFNVDGHSLIALWSMSGKVPLRVRSEKQTPWIDCDLYGNERKGASGVELLETGIQPHFLISKTPLKLNSLIQLNHDFTGMDGASPAVTLELTNPAHDPTKFSFALTAGDVETAVQSLTIPANGKATVSVPLPARRNPVRVEARAEGGLNRTFELEEHFTFQNMTILDPASMRFFAEFTAATIESARVRPGQQVAPEFPANTSHSTWIRPGGRACYPAVWIQDFAIALATGFITSQEMTDHLHLIATSQNGPKERSLKSGAIIPPFAIPDHVLFNGKPVFYPGTYSSGDDQGGEPWGIIPPTNNHYDFILIAHSLWRATGKGDFLREEVNGVPLIERLRLAFQVPRIDPKSGLVTTDDKRRAVGFIFCDSIHLTGDLLFASLLRWRAGGQLAELEEALGNPGKAKEWRQSIATIPEHLEKAFNEPARTGGWLLAATGTGRQPDVWGTIYALYLGLIKGTRASDARAEIVKALREGTICCHGAIRHVPTNHDASPHSAWERTLTPHNTYQNGAYWHTPSGWLIAVLAKDSPELARTVFNEMIEHFKAEDFRKGESFHAPWECFGKNGQAQNNPLFMGSVAVPYGVLKQVAGIGGSSTQ